MDATGALIRQLELDPQALEGVASAYRYKVSIKNEALVGATFCFAENLDIFSFSQVDKKRALKKEEWPVSSSLDVPNRYNVNIQLMAGNTEISQCDGCASWKDKTRKPFLVLTPTGDRVLQYLKNPFILLIFRCCPKFHSCSKQFRLNIIVTSPVTGETFRNEVNIYRKKMVSNKKRKLVSPPQQTSSCSSSPISTPPSSSAEQQQLPMNMLGMLATQSTMPSPPSMTMKTAAAAAVKNTPSSLISSQRETMTMDPMLPVFPYSTKSMTSVVSPQMMYQILYSEKSSSEPPNKKQTFGTAEVTVNRVHTIPILHPIKLEPQVSKPFWNLDAHPNSNIMNNNFNNRGLGGELRSSFPSSSIMMTSSFSSPCPPSSRVEEMTNDEKWLDSVFTDLTATESPSLPNTLDDIGVLLELPTYGMDIPPFHFSY
jgi:hypothetical protein